jgi:hypothetical protein
MVRKGAGGRGGRRFQILAVVLTYWSVGLAYSPLAFKAFADKDAKKSAASTADSTRATGGDSLVSSRAADSAAIPDSAATIKQRRSRKGALTGRELLLGLGAILLFPFVLPVVAILGSMPSGILSALIIGFGLRQAWRMTGVPDINVAGPFKVGAGPSPASP